MNDPLPAASFLNFLSGLGSQALMQLGKIPNPHSGERAVNLPFARYTVELLHILQDKTEGRRTEEEDQYLRGMLIDLQQHLQEFDDDAD